jgi:hypothetical protein
MDPKRRRFEFDNETYESTSVAYAGEITPSSCMDGRPAPYALLDGPAEETFESRGDSAHPALRLRLALA